MARSSQEQAIYLASTDGSPFSSRSAYRAGLRPREVCAYPHLLSGARNLARLFHTCVGLAGHSPVAQAAKPAVSPTAKSAGCPTVFGARRFGNLRHGRLGSLRYVAKAPRRPERYEIYALGVGKATLQTRDGNVATKG